MFVKLVQGNGLPGDSNYFEDKLNKVIEELISKDYEIQDIKYMGVPVDYSDFSIAHTALIIYKMRF